MNGAVAASTASNEVVATMVCEVRVCEGTKAEGSECLFDVKEATKRNAQIQKDEATVRADFSTIKCRQTYNINLPLLCR